MPPDSEVRVEHESAYLRPRQHHRVQPDTIEALQALVQATHSVSHGRQQE
jgi:hypothetical protein